MGHCLQIIIIQTY